MTVDVDLEPVRPAVLDELAAALAKVPPLGDWIDDAACSRLGPHGAEIFTASGVLDAEELDLAMRVCRHCPVRRECAGYAASAGVYGLWGGRWHGANGRGPNVRREAA